MICEPKGGWRHVEVTERRFAHQMVTNLKGSYVKLGAN